MHLPTQRQRVWLVIPRLSDVRHDAMVVDAHEPFVVLTTPEDPDVRAALVAGQTVQVQFFDNDGRVVLDTRVVGLENEGKAVRLQGQESAWSQRRQYLRWQVDLPLRLSYAGADPSEGVVRARMLDVGGGGMAIRTPRELDPARNLVLQVRLPNGPVQAEGRIVNQRPDGAGYRVGVEFVRIAEAARSRIVRFVFEEEMRWKRGLHGGSGER